ncbi:MAG: hypothetical protein Ct9H300mP1_39070 [Planctomycetaceae bacterium]|nr:MAG: hypothetical protein Ct9H300mP1_39070 [Planctomycetaceae bacterium]
MTHFQRGSRVAIRDGLRLPTASSPIAAVNPSTPRRPRNGHLLDKRPADTIEADWLIVGYPQPIPPANSTSFVRSRRGPRGAVPRVGFAPGDLTGKLSESHLLAECRGSPPGGFAGRPGRAGETHVAKTRKSPRLGYPPRLEVTEVSAAIALPQLNSETISDTEAGAWQPLPCRSAASDRGCTGPNRAGTLFGGHGGQRCRGFPAEAVARGSVLGQAMNLTRELVNRGAMEVYPETFADRATAGANPMRTRMRSARRKRLRDERMGSLMAVAQGSVRPPGGGAQGTRRRRGGPGPGNRRQGVTFDSGGLSLKSNEGMKSMKCDMAGAATMLGAMTAIAKLGLPVNVIGLAGWSRTCPTATLQARRRADRQKRKKRSRCSTPTPRDGWSWPTSWPTRSTWEPNA